MSQRTMISTFGVLATAFAWVVFAAPIMPDETKLPDEMRALAQLEQIHLIFDRLPQALVRRGLMQADVERRVRQRMNEEGFKLVENDDVPRLVVILRAMQDDTAPGVLGYTVFLELRQAVRVVRLDDTKLELPTANVMTYGMKQDDGVAAGAIRSLNFALNQFMQFANTATHSREVEQRKSRQREAGE